MRAKNSTNTRGFVQVSEDIQTAGLGVHDEHAQTTLVHAVHGPNKSKEASATLKWREGREPTNVPEFTQRRVLTSAGEQASKNMGPRQGHLTQTSKDQSGQAHLFCGARREPKHDTRVLWPPARRSRAPRKDLSATRCGHR